MIRFTLKDRGPLSEADRAGADEFLSKPYMETQVLIVSARLV